MSGTLSLLDSYYYQPSEMSDFEIFTFSAKLLLQITSLQGLMSFLMQNSKSYQKQSSGLILTLLSWTNFRNKMVPIILLHPLHIDATS
jgi:hypothetical protein